MLRFITLVCLTTACLGSPMGVPKAGGKIINGDDSDIKDFPYQVSVQTGGAHICGATIISTHWALTAATCVGGAVGDMTLRAGSSIRGSGGDVYEVDQFIPHPEFNITDIDYDISLLRVATPFVFGEGVDQVKLPLQDEFTEEGTDCIVSGWGLSSTDGTSPITLQTLHIPVTSDETCKAAYGEDAITDRMICAGFPSGGYDACQGDSGGPLVNEEGVLIGIVSWGRGCALAGFPGVYTKVSSLVDWIKETTDADLEGY